MMAIARRRDSIDPGDPFFYDFAEEVSGPGPHTLIDITTPYGVILSLSRLIINCRLESITEVFVNDAEIGSLRTGAAQPSDSFDWFPTRSLVGGDNLKIKLMKRSGSPDIEVGAHLMGITKST